MRATVTAVLLSTLLHGGAWWAATRVRPREARRAPVLTVAVAHAVPIDVRRDPAPVARAVEERAAPSLPPPAPPPPPRAPERRPPRAPARSSVEERPAPSPARPAASPPASAPSPGGGSAPSGSDAPGSGGGASRRAPGAGGAVDLFAGVALERAAGVERGPGAPGASGGYRPRRGLGGDGARGGIDVGSFLAEDVARSRADKGQVSPELRTLERRVDALFDPPFAHVDVSNKRELLHKQFMARLAHPPKTRELARGVDPTKETIADKRSAAVAEPFFLGRRVEIYVRQSRAGAILDIAIRVGSGFRAFDEEALEAVSRALDGHPPEAADAHGRDDVRTLWRVEATAYVVYSPTPAAIFDESSGKVEWVYPLEKKIDKHVHLVAVY